MPDIEDSDCNGIRDGFVTVTPLGDDMTRHAALDSLGDTLKRLGAHLTHPPAHDHEGHQTWVADAASPAVPPPTIEPLTGIHHQATDTTTDPESL
jgi:hypothetical protein